MDAQDAPRIDDRPRTDTEPTESPEARAESFRKLGAGFAPVVAEAMDRARNVRSFIELLFEPLPCAVHCRPISTDGSRGPCTRCGHVF